MIRLYLIRIVFYVFNIGLEDGTHRLLARFRGHLLNLIRREPMSTPQQITDDIAALDDTDVKIVAAHTALNNLTDAEIAAANAVAVATTALTDLDTLQQSQLDKAIADIKARYGIVDGSGDQSPTMMMGTPPVFDDNPRPVRSGPFATMWAWIKANPDKALKLLSWLALIFGIPIPILKAKIEGFKK